VHLGAQSISNVDEPDRVIIETTNGLVHELYDPVMIENDVALLFLDQDYTVNGNKIKQIFKIPINIFIFSSFKMSSSS